MIDPLTETVLSLAEAAKRLPPRRAGKRPNLQTLYRWTVQGCRGVVLESVQIGGSRMTSLQALRRFFSRLTEQAAAPCPVTTKTADSRRHSAREIEECAALDAAGL
jgi:hypothetical protein